MGDTVLAGVAGTWSTLYIRYAVLGLNVSPSTLRYTLPDLGNGEYKMKTTSVSYFMFKAFKSQFHSYPTDHSQQDTMTRPPSMTSKDGDLQRQQSSSTIDSTPFTGPLEKPHDIEIQQNVLDTGTSSPSSDTPHNLTRTKLVLLFLG